MLLPILTTYIKKEPQELKQVLNLIKGMKRSEETVIKKTTPPHLNPTSKLENSKLFSPQEIQTFFHLDFRRCSEICLLACQSRQTL